MKVPNILVVLLQSQLIDIMELFKLIFRLLLEELLTIEVDSILDLLRNSAKVIIEKVF